MKINKYAQSSPPVGFGAVTTGPVAKPSGSGAGGAYQKPSSYPSGVYGRPTPEEKKEVIRMQETLSTFAQILINKDEQEKLMNSLGVTKEEMKKWSKALISTGGINTFDGKWAEKTSNALKTINEIIARAKSKKLYNGGDVVAQKNYQSDRATGIMADADANVEKIAALASALRIGKHFGKKNKTENMVFDMVPRLLSDNNYKFEFGKEGVPVRASNLWSLYNFYYFLEHNGIVKSAAQKEKLMKLAKHIVSTDIVKEAQSFNASVDFGGGGNQTQTPQAAQPKSQAAPGLRIDELEAAVLWFWKRSNAKLYAVQNPTDPEAEINQADMSKAQIYVAYVTRLYQQFQTWKARGEPSISTLPGGPEERADKTPGGGTGGSYPKPGGSSGREGWGANVGGDDANVLEELKNPPLRDFINIKELANKYNVNISSYSYALKNSWLDVKSLRGSYAPNIYNELIDRRAHKYWADLSKSQGTSVYIYLKQTLHQISGTLGEVFSVWSEKAQTSDQPRDAVEQVIRNQKRKLNEWISVLQRVNDDIDNLVAYERGRFGLK